MNELLIVKLLHILGLVYWLGGDLGVFYSSFAVSNDRLSSEVRVAAAKTLFALDMAPRLCMTMMLPLGLHLSWRMGVMDFGASAMSFIWLAAFAWAGWVLYLHFGSQLQLKAILTRIDYGFRIGVIGMLVWTAAGAALQPTLPYWIIWKLAIFAALIFCGLMVRIALKDFGPAFANLAAGVPTATDNEKIRRSLNRVKPFVVAIWAGLIASAALGVHAI